MKTIQSIRLFESDFLEKLTHVHPLTPLLVWAPVVAFFLWRGFHQALSGPQYLGLATLALLSWTLVEYGIHRFLFHFTPRTPAQKRLILLCHDVHHLTPQDATRLVMPPVVSTVLALAFYGLFRTFIPAGELDTFFGFFLIGYLIYDYTHYSTHFFRPRSIWGRTIKAHHMRHHFVAPDAFYGVSSPLWDYVFRTSSRSSEPKRAKRKAAHVISPSGT